MGFNSGFKGLMSRWLQKPSIYRTHTFTNKYFAPLGAGELPCWEGDTSVRGFISNVVAQYPLVHFGTYV